MDELVPFLVLAGVSTNDIADSLRPILGAQAEGLSPSTVGRMIETRTTEGSAFCC